MNFFAISIGIISGMLFGIATPLSKYLLYNISSFELAGLLYLGAALAFLPYVLKNWKSEIDSIKKWKSDKALIGIIVFGGILGPLLLMMGLQFSKSSSVSVWLNMELVATAILGRFVFNEHIDKLSVIGIVLTLISGILISIQDGIGSLVPILFIIGACISWGLDNHLTASIDGVSPKTITFIKGAVAGSFNLIIGIILSEKTMFIKDVSIALAVGIISYGLSIYLYVNSAQRIGATRSQILFSTAPFWGILIAFIFLSEPITLFIIVAAILLIGGIVLTNIGHHDHSHKHKSIIHTHLHCHDDGHHNHTHESEFHLNRPHIHIHEHEE